MTEEPPRKSHWVTWTLSVIAAIPVLYVLTLPWLLMLVVAVSPSHELGLFWAMYCNPFVWIAENVPHADVLHAYNAWCYHLFSETPDPTFP